jgi:hypothetical protein
MRGPFIFMAKGHTWLGALVEIWPGAESPPQLEGINETRVKDGITSCPRTFAGLSMAGSGSSINRIPGRNRMERVCEPENQSYG